jgi:hypothetical protein
MIALKRLELLDYCFAKEILLKFYQRAMKGFILFGPFLESYREEVRFEWGFLIEF